MKEYSIQLFHIDENSMIYLITKTRKPTANRMHRIYHNLNSGESESREDDQDKK